MREIKFRAWDKRNDEIRYGYPVIEKGVYDHFVEDITGSCFGVGINNGNYGMELMQYTGLKDKNKKETYFGDIAKDKYGQIFEIIDDYSFLANLEDIWFEVIGNIYEDKDKLIENNGNK